jgi:subtilisin
VHGPHPDWGAGGGWPMEPRKATCAHRPPGEPVSTGPPTIRRVGHMREGRRVRTTLTLALATAVTAAMLLISPASAASASGPAGGSWVDVVVVLDAPPSAGAAADAEATARDHGVATTYLYEHALAGFAGAVPEGRLRALQRDPRVASVERDLAVTVAAQTVPTGVKRVFADANPAVPTTGTGRAVDAAVAVIDTGVDASHPDLEVVSTIDCTVESGGGPPWSRTASCQAGGHDDNGHGTHVAGTIAAKDDGSGVVGVAPGARVWGVKVLRADGSGSTATIIAGVDHVTANAAAIDVANMSLGGSGSSSALDTAISNSVAAGVTYVIAAGNESTNVSQVMPAGHPQALTVSALADYDGLAGGLADPTCANHGRDDGFASFSNYGAGVDLIAPGVCIRSTWPGGGYVTGSGTSMAAPHVAGAAALLASTGMADPQIRSELKARGNLDWDASADPDGIKEPLLDVTGFTPVLVGDDGSEDPGGDAGLTVSLSGSATSAKGSWTPTVTATVAEDGTAKTGAKVEMTYRSSRGVTGAVSCTTGSTGGCAVTLPSLANRDGSVTVTVHRVGDTDLDDPVSITITKP